MGKNYFKQQQERLYNGLSAIGVHPQLVEEYSKKQDIGFKINIAQSPISWIIVSREIRDDNEFWETVYGVLDSRRLPLFETRAVRIKSFPLFGKVFDVRWEPIDDYGIAQALTNDSAIKSSIMKVGSFFTDHIVASWGIGYWSIKCNDNTTIRIPSLEEWSLYETIAKRLLATPLTHKNS